MADYDLLSNIAVIKSEGKSKTQKLKEAKNLLKIPSVKTVVEKVSNVKGRLRTIKVKHLLGEKNLIAKHKENDCVFKFNIETCYFSPRLSNERKEIANKIKKRDRVLVMFSGVAPFAIVIAKHSKPKQVFGLELGKDCNNYAKENIKLNHVDVNLIQGDVKKKIKNLGKFDVVVMPRPNLKESFLEQGLSACKKGSRIYYHAFGRVDEKKKIIDDLIEEAKKLKKKIKILKIVKAGEIAPYKFRYRIEIKVL